MLEHLCLFIASFSQIQSHLIVGDKTQALAAARECVARHPDDVEGRKWLIKTLGANGAEGEMLKHWRRLEQISQEEAYSRALLEEMCWAVVREGERAPGMSTRLISLVGAALTQDVRGMRALKEGLSHPNSHLRAVAVELASHYHDLPLKEEIVHLFHHERVWQVRKGVIHAVGKLKLQELEPELLEILSSPQTGAEEKAVVTEALVNMREEVRKEEIERLVQSGRAALKVLACECLVHAQEKSDVVFALAYDSHPEVRTAAFRTMGLLRLKPNVKEERDPEVAVSLAWALLLAGDPAGTTLFEHLLHHDKREVRLLAAGAVATSGAYGVPLARAALEHPDPYVRLNVALGLLGQRVEVQRAAKELDTFMRTHPDRLMEGEGLFSPIQKSTVIHRGAIPNFPEAVNQKVRLHLLNLLAIVEYEGAREALRTFLKERHWGLTGLAAEMLLGEGDETAIDLLRSLLDDLDKAIRCEAALALATWGKEPTALPTLMEAYARGDRELKIKILEAVGNVGGKEAIPFLIARLEEPSQTFRIIAASMLIHALNH